MTKHESLWREIATPQFAAIKSKSHFDVVVIGGGITGLTAAYLLQQSGKRVAVLERYRLGAGDTGNTTAHLTALTDLRVSQLVSNFGKEDARLVWRGGMAAIATIEAIAQQSNCEFQRLPGFLHLSLAGDDDNKQRLKDEAELIREFGTEASFTSAVPYFDLPGIRIADQAKFHPLKYLRLLADQITAGGDSAIFENCDVTEVQGDPLAAVVNDEFEVSCDYLIIATHVPLAGKTGLVSATAFQSKLAPYTSYVVGAEVAKGTVPQAIYWDTADPYYYLAR